MGTQISILTRISIRRANVLLWEPGTAKQHRK